MYCGISVFAEGEDVSLPWQYNTVVHDFSSFTTKPTAWRANAGSEPYFTTKDNLDYTGGNIKVSYPKLGGTEMTWELKLGTTSLFTAADKAVSIDVEADFISDEFSCPIPVVRSVTVIKFLTVFIILPRIITLRAGFSPRIISAILFRRACSDVVCCPEDTQPEIDPSVVFGCSNLSRNSLYASFPS